MVSRALKVVSCSFVKFLYIFTYLFAKLQNAPLSSGELLLPKVSMQYSTALIFSFNSINSMDSPIESPSTPSGISTRLLNKPMADTRREKMGPLGTALPFV